MSTPKRWLTFGSCHRGATHILWQRPPTPVALGTAPHGTAQASTSNPPVFQNLKTPNHGTHRSVLLPRDCFIACFAPVTPPQIPYPTLPPLCTRHMSPFTSTSHTLSTHSNEQKLVVFHERQPQTALLKKLGSTLDVVASCAFSGMALYVWETVRESHFLL